MPTVFHRAAPRVHWALPDGGQQAVRAVVLVLHGGKVRSRRKPEPWQLAVARMHPYATVLHRATRGDGVAVGNVLFRVRGWNAPRHHTPGDCAAPVADLHAVLDGVRARFGAVPVVVVGHSMGGRAALRCADDPTVTAVLGLAPWIEAGEPVRPGTSTSILVLHGDQDRWTDARASAAWVREARAKGARAGYVSIAGDGHSMLKRAGLWHELTVAFVAAVLGLQSGDERATNVVSGALCEAAPVHVAGERGAGCGSRS